MKKVKTLKRAMEILEDFLHLASCTGTNYSILPVSNNSGSVVCICIREGYIIRSYSNGPW